MPISRGGTASALMHVDWRGLGYFLSLQGVPPPWMIKRDPLVYGERVQISVELVWPEAEEVPTLVGFVSLHNVFAQGLLRFDREETEPPGD